jgi:hypothetical protein
VSISTSSPFPQRLVARKAVWIGGGAVELHGAEGRAPVGPGRAVGGVDEPLDGAGGDPRRQHGGGPAMDVQGDGLGVAHQGQFGRRLAGPAAVDHRGRVERPQRRRGRVEGAEQRERRGRVERQDIGPELGKRLTD